MPANRTSRIAAASVLLLFGWAAAAGAQQPAPSGPLVLEPLHNGFLLAPDVKVTKVDGNVGTLAGGYAGWVKDDHLFIGGGAYWLADHKKNTHDLAYGGFVVGWFFDPTRPVSFSVKALAGVGQFSEPFDVHILVRDNPLPVHAVDNDRLSDQLNQQFRFRSDFFVLEPEFDVQARLSRRVRLSAGVGYRAADEPRGFNGVARGATGSVSVQFNLGK